MKIFAIYASADADEPFVRTMAETAYAERVEEL